jgi:hypothetical protein
MAVASLGPERAGSRAPRRTPPGPLYQVSIKDIHDGSPFLVTQAQYRLWQARFARMDGIFAVFALILVVSSLALLHLHRKALAEPPGQAQQAPAAGA